MPGVSIYKLTKHVADLQTQQWFFQTSEGAATKMLLESDELGVIVAVDISEDEYTETQYPLNPASIETIGRVVKCWNSRPFVTIGPNGDTVAHWTIQRHICH